MINVMFVCHGNICRSPMAEFVFNHMAQNEGLQNKIHAVSSATSTEEIGNPVHYGTRKILAHYGIDTTGKYAVQFKKSDYDKYDYILVMDSMNMRNLTRIIGEDPLSKVGKLTDFTNGGDIADPWYTGDFEATYADVEKACRALIEHIRKTF